MNKIIDLAARKRASFANRLPVDAMIMGGAVGELMKKWALKMAENDVKKEKLAMQNIAASKSRFINITKGNA